MRSVSLTNYKHTQDALDYALNVSRGTLPGRDCNDLEKLACDFLNTTITRLKITSMILKLRTVFVNL